MRVCVTGATGFIGANLVRALLARGDEVRCIVRKPNRCVADLDLELVQAPLVPQDAAEREALTRALDGCEGIYHLAGIFDPSAGGEERMRAVHVDATRSLVELGARVGIQRMVLCSSSITVGFGPKDSPGDEDTSFDPAAVYGRTGPLRAYHDTKLAAETFVAEQQQMDGVTVNPDYIIGPWDVKPTSGQLIVSMARRWMPVYFEGGKCFQAARDCAQGHIAAMLQGQPGRRYLLGSHNLSYQEFMGVVSDVVGRRPPALPLPGWAVGAAAVVGKIGRRIDPHRFAGLDADVLRSTQHERYRCGARARQELGVADTPIEVAVQAAYRWFRDHGYC